MKLSQNMTDKEVLDLIKSSNWSSNKEQIWLDLGCGSGTFTKGLAELLPAGSQVIAIDRDPQKLPTFSKNGNTISFIQSDLSKLPLPITQSVDGILMANFLHYIEDPKVFIGGLINKMRPPRHFIIVEYDTEDSNPWVPYPVSFINLTHLFPSSYRIRKLKQRRSTYNTHWMYAAEIMENQE